MRLRSRTNGLWISLIVIAVLLAWALPALANTKVRVASIKSDSTWNNKTVCVTGIVTQVAPVAGGGSRWGKFILEDNYGDSVLVETRWLPAHNSTVTIEALVMWKGNTPQLRQLQPGMGACGGPVELPTPTGEGGTGFGGIDPFIWIAIAFVVIMIVLLAYLFWPKKKAPQPQVVVQPPVQTGGGGVTPPPMSPPTPPAPSTEDFETWGTLYVLASKNPAIVGTDLLLGAVAGTTSVLMGRPGDSSTVQCDDPSLSRDSIMFMRTGLGKIAVVNKKSGRTLTVVTPGGGRQVLQTNNPPFDLNHGDVLEQERSQLRVEFRLPGTPTVDA